MVTLANEEIKMITYFEGVTKASVKDCVLLEDKIIFVVAPGNLGRAIGKGGSIIQDIRRRINKKIVVVEYRENLNDFLNEFFFPVKIDVQVSERMKEKIATIKVRENDRGLVLGRGGEKIKDAKMLAMRYFDTDLKVFSVK